MLQVLQTLKFLNKLAFESRYLKPQQSGEDSELYVLNQTLNVNRHSPSIS